jgi:hypothetical protein
MQDIGRLIFPVDKSPSLFRNSLLIVLGISFYYFLLNNKFTYDYRNLTEGRTYHKIMRLIFFNEYPNLFRNVIIFNTAQYNSVG